MCPRGPGWTYESFNDLEVGQLIPNKAISSESSLGVSGQKKKPEIWPHRAFLGDAGAQLSPEPRRANCPHLVTFDAFLLLWSRSPPSVQAKVSVVQDWKAGAQEGRGTDHGAESPPSSGAGMAFPCNPDDCSQGPWEP